MSVFIKPWWIKNVWRRVVPSDVRFAVTLRSRDLSNDAVAAFTDYALTHAKLRTSDIAEDQEGGAVVDGYSSASWLVWQDDLDAAGAPDPKVGDEVVQSDGTRWRVTRVKNTLMREVWDLAVRQAT
jgi:hypothetical protein